MRTWVELVVSLGMDLVSLTVVTLTGYRNLGRPVRLVMAHCATHNICLDLAFVKGNIPVHILLHCRE